MTLFLVLAGILLAGIGIWGGPRVAERKAERKADAKGKKAQGDPWDIITEPITYEEELIRIPEHRPWYMPGRDRRFQQGLLVGLGAGLMVAGAVTLVLPREALPPGPLAAEEQPAPTPTPTPTTPAEPAPTTPATPAEPAPTTPPVQEAPPPKPINVTFTVEVGDLAPTIAANLKKANLIQDEDAFLERVAERRVDTRLKAGTFVIPTEASLDDVIDALTA